MIATKQTRTKRSLRVDPDSPAARMRSDRIAAEQTIPLDYKWEVAKRLKRSREAAGFPTAFGFAKHRNIPPSTYANFESGGRLIPPELAAGIMDELKFTLDYLYAGKGPGAAEPLPIVPLAGEPVVMFNLGDIAALSAIGSGVRPTMATEVATLSLPRLSDNEGENIFIQLPDDAMKSDGPVTFSAGDAIKIDPKAPIVPGCFVVAMVEGRQSAVFRRLRVVSEDPQRIELIPLNRDYPSIFIDEERKGRIIARAVGRFHPV